jgi:pre-mRNA-splicing factor CWC22
MNRREGPGGIYIPPYRLKNDELLTKVVEENNESSELYQRMTWEALKKSLNGLINKVNASNLKNIIVELFSENLLRERGLFVRSLLKAQAASLPFTSVFSALLAVLNAKLPILGELAIKKLVLQFRRSYRRNDKVPFYYIIVIRIGLVSHFLDSLSGNCVLSSAFD